MLSVLLPVVATLSALDITAAVMDVPVGRPQVAGRSIPTLVCKFSYILSSSQTKYKISGWSCDEQPKSSTQQGTFVRTSSPTVLVTLYMKVVPDQRQDACSPVKIQAKDQPGGTS